MRLFKRRTYSNRPVILTVRPHKIELTLIDGLSENDELLKEEIFGPILPVLTYQDIEEVFDYVRAHEKPLAAYLFTNDRDLQKHFCKDLSFGGGCINTTLLHLSNSEAGLWRG